jgi:hypothetical protein
MSNTQLLIKDLKCLLARDTPPAHNAMLREGVEDMPDSRCGLIIEKNIDMAWPS